MKEKAIQVRSRVTDFDEPNTCFLNVTRAVAAHGGKMRLGWLRGHVIFPEKAFIQMWVHHAVWEMPDGELRDLTPQLNPTDGDFAVLQGVSMFVPDDEATLIAVGDLWQSRSPVYEILIDEPKVRRGVEFLRAADEKIKHGDLKGEAYWCQRAADVLGGWVTPMGIHVMAPFSLGTKP